MNIDSRAVEGLLFLQDTFRSNRKNLHACGSFYQGDIFRNSGQFSPITAISDPDIFGTGIPKVLLKSACNAGLFNPNAEYSSMTVRLQVVYPHAGHQPGVAPHVYQ